MWILSARRDTPRHPRRVARTPIPPRLASNAFLVSDSGLGEGRLRGPDLARPHRGVRVVSPSGPADYAPLLRTGERFSHVTAAMLWPLPLPLATYPIHVTVSHTLAERRNPARGRGIVGHTSLGDASTVRHSMRVSAPEAMFVELATLLSHDDLVAVGDALVLEPHELDPLDIRPWIGLDTLRRACAETRSPGARAARRAAADVRQGAESRPETLLRLLLVKAGLPEPALAVEVSDANGRWIGRFDMVYAEAKVIVEYDGDQHRTSRIQYEKDMVRIDRAIAAGWTVIRVRSRGLFRARNETVARVQSALEK